MGFGSRMKALFGGGKKSSAAMGYVYESGWIPAIYDPLNWNGAVNAAQFNGIVFSCLSVLARTFPEPEVKIYDPETSEEIRGHEAGALLAMPYSPASWGGDDEPMSAAELALYTIYYLSVGGNCYWYKIRNANGRVVGFLPLHAGNVTPINARGKRSGGYIVNSAEANRQSFTVPPSEIVHLKWASVNMTNPVLGLSPLVAVAAETGAGEQATRYVETLLQNDAMPRTIITAAPEYQFTDDTIARLKTKFAEGFGGKNMGKPLFLEGGVTIQRLGLNLQELNLETLATIPETRIAAAFGVPPILAGLNTGLKTATYSNYEQAMKAFTQYTLIPLWRLVADQITESLRIEYPHLPPFAVRYDLSTVAALQSNMTEKQALAQTAFTSGIMTLNEARRVLGLQDVPEGGAFQRELQPPMVLTAPPVIKRRVPRDSYSYELFDGVKALEAGDMSEDVKTKYWQKYDALMKSSAEDLQADLEGAFGEVEKVAVAAVEKGVEISADDIARIVMDRLEDSLKAEFLTAFQTAVAETGERWNAVKPQFDSALQEAMKQVTETIKPVGATVRDEIVSLAKANAGQTREKLRALISEYFTAYSGASAWRSERIATTVTTFITGYSQRAVFEKLGFTQVWLSERDNKVRPSHRKLDGAQADAAGYFVTETGARAKHPGGFGVPAEDINCRCVLVPGKRS